MASKYEKYETDYDAKRSELLLLYSRMQRLHLLSDTLHMYSTHCGDILTNILQNGSTPNVMLLQYVTDINNIITEINGVQKEISITALNSVDIQSKQAVLQ